GGGARQACARRVSGCGTPVGRASARVRGDRGLGERNPFGAPLADAGDRHSEPSLPAARKRTRGSRCRARFTGRAHARSRSRRGWGWGRGATIVLPTTGATILLPTTGATILLPTISVASRDARLGDGSVREA